MTKTFVTCMGVAAAVSALAGCKETTSSANIRTPGIAASINVTAESADASDMIVRLQVGGTGATATYVDLSGGDRIYAEADGDRQEMQVESSGVYQADFQTAAEDTAFRVSLEREQDDSAPDSTGTLPAPFTLESLEGQTFSRATDDVMLTWDPGGSTDDMEVSWNGDCVFIGSENVDGDSGMHTISAGTIDGTHDDDPDRATCDVSVTVKRIRNGTADSHFDPDSYFRLEQVRTTEFTSAL